MIRGATASTNQARMLAWIIISFALALQMSVAHAQIVSPTRQRAYRALLPTVSDAELQELLDDPGLVYWDEATHPRAYQAFGAHFHRASYNLSGARDKTGNAAADFPWRSTVGTDECRDLWTFKAMRLPQRSPDAIWPVVWHSSWTDTFRHQPARERRWRWMWPKGSEFLEVIVWRYRGADYPICVLYRVKEDAGYGTVHGVEVAVPYAEQDDYIQDLAEIAGGDAARAHLSGIRVGDPIEIADSHGRRRAFASRASVATRPPLPGGDSTALRMLSRSWDTRSGMQWDDERNVDYPEGSGSGLHVVPAGFRHSHVLADREDCSACHRDTLAHVTHFGPLGRDWYGSVPGSDGILSLYIASPSSVSRRGNNLAATPDKRLTDAGILERYDSEKHPAEIYGEPRRFR